MSGNDDQLDWARDADPFFTFLGIYVASFQFLEGILDQIILLEAGDPNREKTLLRLSDMRHYDKIEAVSHAAANLDRFPRLQKLEGWPQRVSEVVGCLHKERRRRNGLLHSQYWMKGLELGLSALRTDTRRKEGALEISREDMDRERMDNILEELALLSFHAEQIHIQLVHVCEDT